MREDPLFLETVHNKNVFLKLISLIINLRLVTILWYMWNILSREKEEGKYYAKFMDIRRYLQCLSFCIII